MDTPPTIGVLSPFVSGFYFGGVIRGVANAAAEAGRDSSPSRPPTPASCTPSDPTPRRIRTLPLGVTSQVASS